MQLFGDRMFSCLMRPRPQIPELLSLRFQDQSLVVIVDDIEAAAPATTASCQNRDIPPCLSLYL